MRVERSTRAASGVEEKKFGGKRVRRHVRCAKLRDAEFESGADVHASATEMMCIALSVGEFLFQAFGFVVAGKSVDERSEFPFHHVSELVQSQADAVIGDAILREIV